MDDRADRDPIRISHAFDTGSGRPAARVLLDGSTLEIFTSAGRSATTRVYPLSAPPWRVAAGNGVLVWELRGAMVDSHHSTADRDAGGVPVVREA